MSALVPVDATWAGKNVELALDGGPAFLVALGPASNTNALVIGDLSKDPRFAGTFVADELNGVVRIRTLEAGAPKTVKANMPALPAAFGATGTIGAGSDADYRVTLVDGDLINGAGAPAKSTVACCRKGHFNSAKIRNLTPEAKVVLIRRGAFFD